MDDVLQFLEEIGVVEKTNNLPAPAPPAPAPTFDAIIGDPASNSGQLGQQLPQAPKTQPSLFRKALAFTLSEYLSTATDLSDVECAFFLGEPDQAGVPAGKAYPETVTNYQTFLKTDTVQTLNNPAYSINGDSYFEYLATYLRNVVSPNEPAALTEAREKLLQAKKAKQHAYQQARRTYLHAKPDPSLQPLGFSQSLSADRNYNAAWQAEVDAEKAYTDLQSDDMYDVSLQLEQIRSADDRLAERVNNNMPCIAVSDDYINNPVFGSDDKLKIDPNDVYYRPFCNLPDFALTCNNWQNLNTSPATTKRYTVPISLLDAQNRRWAELGHAGLDTAVSPTLTAPQTAMLTKLSFSITFIGKPAVMDIDRGFWDVPNVRKKPWKVAKTLPAALQRPFCKTIRMMFAWSVEFTIKLLPESPTAHAAVPPSTSNGDLRDINLGYLKIGLLPDQSTPDEIKFSSGSSPYPLLLAILAQTI